MRYFIGECRHAGEANRSDGQPGDTLQSGRVQIRVYGKQDNEQNNTDSGLQWAMPLQSVTSSATQKMGSSPTGMIVGSRVFGFYMDDAEQHPIILGTFARGGSQDSGATDNMGGIGDVVQANTDVHQAAQSLSGTYTPMSTQSNTLTPNARYDFTSVSAYNAHPYKPNGSGVEYTGASKNTYAQYSGNWPTIASVAKTDAINKYGGSPPNVLKMIQAVDPQSQSAIIPQAVNNFQKIISTMSTAMAGQSGMGTNGLTGSSLGGALTSMASTMGAAAVVNAVANAAGINAVSANTPVTNAVAQQMATLLNQFGGLVPANEVVADLDPTTSEIVYLGLLQLLNSVGPNLQVGTYDTATGTVSFDNVSTSNTPVSNTAPGPVVGSPPDGSFQVFTYSPNDPHPGYNAWENLDGSVVYTVANTPYAASPEQDAVNAAMAQMIVELQADVRAGTVTMTQLEAAIGIANQLANNQVTQNTLGVGSAPTPASGGGTSSTSISSILGKLFQMIQQSDSTHLPNSVLNQSGVQQSLQNYQKAMGIIKQSKNYANTATSQLIQSPNFNSKTGGMGGAVSSSGGGAFTGS